MISLDNSRDTSSLQYDNFKASDVFWRPAVGIRTKDRKAYMGDGRIMAEWDQTVERHQERLISAMHSSGIELKPATSSRVYGRRFHTCSEVNIAISQIQSDTLMRDRIRGVRAIRDVWALATGQRYDAVA